ncbi:hypothetical protein GIB67_035826 [Kingdonia uniflora]|uniref:Aldehyde dehydrogenase domain-containing protein n=1 Tax=Kingdonia uniflora TaxID=39325 RepID=A0A7J7MJJ8_9MAGN|nr:hypothetical protein GIB67_035826 [Kingdonia uniflora]
MINYGGSGGMDFSDIDVALEQVKCYLNCLVQSAYYPLRTTPFVSSALALDPLIRVIDAGNVVVLKPSELAPACYAHLANTIPSYMDDKAIMVAEGGASIGKQLLDYKWDKIFFTYTSTTVIYYFLLVEILNNILIFVYIWFQVVIKRIVGGKWGFCSGQACIGVDYLFVEDKFLPSLVTF